MNKQELITNKQELISKYELIKNSFNFDTVATDGIISDLKRLDEPEKVTIPQFVADWIERSKQEKRNLRNALNNGGEKMRLWFLDQENYDLFGRAWLDGYEVEKEKRYVVTLKNRQPLVKSQSGSILYFSQDITAWKYKVTKKELEDANFGWVFDCEGIEIEEVE